MMDPYSILGVSRTATEEEIKTAYRKLSRMYHPDANVGNPRQAEYEEKFKEVQQAYKAVMDERQGKTTNTYNQSYNQNPYGQSGYTYDPNYNRYNTWQNYQQKSSQYGGNPYSYRTGGIWPLCLGLLCANMLCGGGYFMGGLPLICCI